MSQGYPTRRQVEVAGLIGLTGWLRWLPSPNDENREIMDLIVRRHGELKAADPAAAVHASKVVGW